MSNAAGGGPVPPGWYQDNQGTMRWWDGSRFTEHTQPQLPPRPPGAGVKTPWYKNTVMWVVAVFVILGIAGIAAASLGGGDDDDKPTTAASTDVAQPEEDESESESPSPSSEPEPEPEPEPESESVEPEPETETVEPEPGLTTSQENAIGTAEDYLGYSSFSRQGLIDQLEFEGYSTKDATFAVDSLKVDWNEQAAKSAQQYLDYTTFSRSGLIDQLVFSGFTRAQAEYGVNQVGL